MGGAISISPRINLGAMLEVFSDPQFTSLIHDLYSNRNTISLITLKTMLRKWTDVTVIHEWSNAEIHESLAGISSSLSSVDLSSWYNEKMKKGMAADQELDHRLRYCSCVVVVITKRYCDKLSKDFMNAEKIKGVDKMIPLVMDENVKELKNWGVLRAKLRTRKPFIDMTEEVTEDRVQQLFNAIIAKIGLPAAKFSELLNSHELQQKLINSNAKHDKKKRLRYATVPEIGNLLANLKFIKYRAIALKNRIDGAKLSNCKNREDLQQLGFSDVGTNDSLFGLLQQVGPEGEVSTSLLEEPEDDVPLDVDLDSLQKALEDSVNHLNELNKQEVKVYKNPERITESNNKTTGGTVGDKKKQQMGKKGAEEDEVERTFVEINLMWGKTAEEQFKVMNKLFNSAYCCWDPKARHTLEEAAAHGNKLAKGLLIPLNVDVPPLRPRKAKIIAKELFPLEEEEGNGGWLMNNADRDPTGYVSFLMGFICSDVYKEEFIEKSVGFYQASAAKDNPAAKYKIGMMYECGIGVPVDKEKAIEKGYQPSAEHGFLNAVAQFSMLNMDKNPAKSIEWLSKAADKGCTTAQVNLGRCYELGLGGVTVDQEKALGYYQKAGLK